MDHAISIESVRKEYGDVAAVDDLTLTVRENEVFGFLGPNGAGKSTTIDVLLNHVRPTAGSVTVLGHDVVREPTAVRERVGVLSDGYGLYDRLTGREHVDLAIELADASDDPDAILERVGVADAADRRVGGYSKGMCQRLALGMALVGSPDLLLFDEPSSGLDPTGVRRLREIVREEVARGATVFFSSHDLDQVEAVCDRVGILHAGSLVAVDTVEGLRDRLGTASALRVDADPLPDPDVLAGLDGVRSATVADGQLVVDCANGGAKIRTLDAVRDAGATVADFRTESASLEELFAASLDGIDADGSGRATGSPEQSERGEPSDDADRSERVERSDAERARTGADA
ncbi:ABC transporter ATP-binding protein [Halorarum halobium]|uniref:ABC transporter ATP-binding protein n=1 Tax=Halorarum halobium TaxID=3075121 RepID=UPI0028AD1DEF|nr:ABC transporter ATP-binding protein [Halobaculum sp. XH14]